MPKRVGKKKAAPAYAKAIKEGASPAEILAGAKRYAAEMTAKGTDPQYIAGPQAWLNAGRWEDEPVMEKQKGGYHPWNR